MRTAGRFTLAVMVSSCVLTLTSPPAYVDAAHAHNDGAGGDLGEIPELESHRLAGGVKSVVTQFTGQHGLVAIGMVAELQNELQSAFCDQSGSRVYKCAEYEESRERLWYTFANDYICGMAPEDWSGHSRVRELPIQEQFEYLLSQCESPWAGDLVAVVREATMVFLAQSTLNRPDIKAVVEENDRKAGRPETLPTDDLYALHPGYYQDIAPVTTNVREPMVATWKVEKDLDGHTPYAEGGVPRLEALNARKGKLIATEGPTEQYPVEFELELSRGSPGQVLYRASYQSHPSALAKWDDGYCELQDAGDTLCFPRVVPHVGYTHDWNGRRLRTNYGRQLPSGYVDPNVG